MLWAGAVAVGQTLQAIPLATAVATATAVAFLVDAARTWRLMRRLRWLALAIGVLFAFATPGVYLLPTLGGASPTTEGVTLALTHLGRLILLVALLAILLARCAPADIVAGLYWLAAPLARLGVDRRPLAVRLMLVLDSVASAPAQGWRDWLAATPGAPPAPQSVRLRLPQFGAADGLTLALAAGAALAWWLR